MSIEDNISKQFDEIEALSAIYGDDWKVLDEYGRKYSVTICEEQEGQSKSVTLEVSLPETYPSESPPIYQLSMPWLRGHKRVEIDNAMCDIYIENYGESIIYMWIEKLREFILEELANSVTDIETEELETTDQVEEKLENKDVSQQSENVYECPVIHHGEPLFDRKSKFQAHLAPVFFKEQVQMVLDKLYENRKVAAATHNIYSYRILKEVPGKRPISYQSCEDDGEIHAGNRMLHLMQIIDCQNVMVIVTRWYGGIHLGPDRFKHINSLTRNILEEHGYIKDLKKEKKGGKKK